MHQFNHKLKAKSMNPDTRRQQGATLIVGVLILMLIVVGVFIIASNFMLTGRRTTGDQTSIMHAQYAADSGIAYADASFKTLKKVLEEPIIPKQSGGANVTIANFKTELAKLCKSGPSTDQWDYAKNTDTKTVRSVHGVKGSMLGKSVCQVKKTPAENDLDFFFKYYPKETAGFVNAGITTDADAKDFLKKSLIAGDVAVEYGEGVQQRSSRMLEPIWLTTIKTGTYRLYFKIPDFESTGTFAKSTRKKVMSSTKTLYYLEIALPRGGKTDFFAYKLDQTMGPGTGDQTGSAHEYQSEFTNNAGFDCRDYFEGPVHINTYLRVDPYACQGTTTSGDLSSGGKVVLAGSALTGPVINGKFTSTSCIEPNGEGTACKKKGSPNGFSYTYLRITNTGNSQNAVVNTNDQKKQTIGNITAAVASSAERGTLYQGPYSAGLDSNVLGFGWLPVNSAGFGSVTAGDYSRHSALLSNNNAKGIKKDQNTYGIITGVDALETALNGGTTKAMAAEPEYNADYEPMTEDPKEEGDFYSIQNEANLKGVYVAQTIHRVRLSVETLQNVAKIENGKATTGTHSPKAQVMEFTHETKYGSKYYIAYTKSGDTYIKVPKTLESSGIKLRSTRNKWVPAALDSNKKKHLDSVTDGQYDGRLLNYKAAGSGTVAKIIDPIIYVQGSDTVLNLTGPERADPTSLTADPSKPAVAEFTQMSVIVSGGDLVITGDLLYEKTPCSLNVPTLDTSCEKDATGEYRYRNLLGIYNVKGNVLIAYGEGESTKQITVRSNDDDDDPYETLRAPNNLVLDAFIMAPKGSVGYPFKTAETDTDKVFCKPENIKYPKGRVTFRGTVETKYIGHFKLGCNSISQSYILDNRAIQMTPPGFPSQGATTSKDTDNLKSLKVTMANSDAKGHVSSANLIGEWKQARR